MGYWEGCGPSCCRWCCDCEEVRKWKFESNLQIAALTPERWSEIWARAKQMAKEMEGWSE